MYLFLYKRPEFVQKYKKRLCPDSFSMFLSKENSKELNENVIEASQYLHSFTIPRLSETLIFSMHRFLVSGKDFSQFPLIPTVTKNKKIMEFKINNFFFFFF